MSYTEEFEHFAVETYADKEQYPCRSDYEQAHITLAAFAKLVREEAYKQPLRQGESYAKHTAAAFNAICERFGLSK